MKLAALLMSSVLVGLATHAEAAQRPTKHSKHSRQNAELVPLQWRQGQAGVYAYRPLATSILVPRDLTLPTGLQSPTHFSIIPFADQQSLVVAVAFEKDKTYLWVDQNFNHDLTDDPPLAWQRVDGAWQCSVSVVPTFVGESDRLEIAMQFRCRVGAPLATLEFLALAHKGGEVVLSERLREVVLIDESSTLDFSGQQHVALILDVDGDGFLNLEHGSHEHFHSAESFKIAKEVWQFRGVGRGAGAILLLPSDAPPVLRTRRWQPAAKPMVQAPAPAGVSVANLMAQYEKEERLQYQERTSTVVEIGAVGSRAAFMMLQRIAQSDKQPRLQRQAIVAMGRPEYLECGREFLLELVKGGSTQSAEAALTALYLLDDPNFHAVVQKLVLSKTAEIANQAALFLGYCETSQAQLRVDQLLSDSRAGVRRHAYRGLRSTAAGPSAAQITKLLGDADFELRAMAMLDLLATANPHATRLAQEAADIALWSGNQAYKEAVLTVLTDSDDVKLIRTAMNMIVKDPWASLHDLGVARLARLRSSGALKLFQEALAGPTASHRMLAARILARFRDPQSFNQLIQHLGRERDDDVAVEILWALGESRDPAAIPVLLSTARTHGPVRLAAITALGNFALDRRDVRNFLLSMLESDDWQDRVLAIDAIANSKDATFASQLWPALQHEHWPVRLAAIEALRYLRNQQSIAPLVAQLQVESHLRLRKAMGQTLFVLTGQNPHMSANAWLGWWQSVEASFKMSDSLPKPRAATGTISKSNFYGLSLDSDRVIFVIDQSGSMAVPTPAEEFMPEARTRLDQALANAIRSIETLKEDALVNVVLFNTDVQRWKDKMQVLNKSNRKSLMKFLDVQKPGGATNLFDALEYALKQSDVDRILLLSDGEPTAGRIVASEEILREVRRLNEGRRIAIDCVALGIESPLLKRLAAENDGRYIKR